MRTKTLILTAAIGLAGAASSMAQVYSVNAVGYINLSFVPGFTMMANQLDNGADNLVSDLFTGAPEGTTVYKFKSDTGTYDINILEFGEWSNPAMTLVPGEGAFVRNTTADPFNVTLVGEVPQGTLTTPVPATFAILSSQVPQAGQLDTVLGFPVDEGDTVYRWAAAAQTYVTSIYEFGEWSVPPELEVGQAFFSKAATAKDWTREFSVND